MHEINVHTVCQKAHAALFSTTRITLMFLKSFGLDEVISLSENLMKYSELQ